MKKVLVAHRHAVLIDAWDDTEFCEVLDEIMSSVQLTDSVDRSP